MNRHDSSQPTIATPRLGERYINVNPELDLDHCSRERTTKPGHEWRVAANAHDHVTVVCDATGAVIKPTRAELGDRTHFVRLQPRVLDPTDEASWRKVESHIAQSSYCGERVAIDRTSADFQVEGLYLRGLISLFVPAHVYR
ncbi:hypothetical protein QRO11_10165 [Paracidovorax citrulli]|uniref:hypothetical protein n=1 Tax=Paracidovorax citrulli TaxID=80869 RepID=UPI00255CA7CB|nr:hypothetical protein [Paracidovorax citrulli]WIY36657.1 hypothetical protein QRO11_10165 [Paracidovorax citrulli]